MGIPVFQFSFMPKNIGQRPTLVVHLGFRIDEKSIGFSRDGFQKRCAATV